MITKADYIELPIDPLWIEAATHGDDRYLHLRVGRLLAADYFCADPVRSFHFDFRFIGSRYSCSVYKSEQAPNPGSEVRVFFSKPEFLSRKNTEFFCFVRITPDFSRGWILGKISWERLVSIGHLVMKGETPAGGKSPAKTSSLSLEIRHLDPVFKTSYVPREIPAINFTRVEAWKSKT